MKFRLQILLPFLVCLIALSAVSCKSASEKSDKEAAKKSDTEAESGASDLDFEQLLKLIQALKDQDFDGAMKMAEEQKILKSEDGKSKDAKSDSEKSAEKASGKASDKESSDKPKADADVKAESDHDEL